MRWIPYLVACAAVASGCTLFGDRPCATGRYLCPSPDLGPLADGGAGSCSIDRPCMLAPPVNRSLGSAAGDLLAIYGSSGPAGEQVFIAGRTSATQGVLWLAQPAQPIRMVATLPSANPRAVATTPDGSPSVFVASQGNALYQYDASSGLLSPLSLDTGDCMGRINPSGALNGLLALAGPDLWIVGAPTKDAAAGLFRLHGAACQVLPELASAGLGYYGVWGTPLSGDEPSDRIVWTVGDSGAAVLWTIAAADGSVSAERLATSDGNRLIAVSGSASCPGPLERSDGGTGSACAYMIAAGALYHAVNAAPERVPLPSALQQATFTSLYVDSQSVWLAGTLAGAGLIVRYKPQSAWFAYASGLPPAGGLLRAVWGDGAGSLWVVGDQGTVLYLPPQGQGQG